jgi:hypothetical protein
MLRVRKSMASPLCRIKLGIHEIVAVVEKDAAWRLEAKAKK